MRRRQPVYDDPRRGVWCRTGSLRTAATLGLFALTRARLCLLVAFAAAMVLCPVPGLARAAAVVEYEVPSRDGVRIAAGPDGAMWFTEPSNHLIGRISTSTGAIREFGGISDSADLWDITLGPDGAMWFLERGDASQVGRITTAGTVTEYPLPAAATEPGGIAAGPDGNLWINADTIVRMNTSGAVTGTSLVAGGACASGITAGPDGNMWGASCGAVRKISTADGSLTTYPLPAPDGATYADAQWIRTGPDGALWFSEPLAHNVGRMTTDGSTTNFAPPGGFIAPTDLAPGPDGGMWVTDGFGAALYRMSAAGQGRQVLAHDEGGTYDWRASPDGIAQAANGTLWFADPMESTDPTANIKARAVIGCYALPGATGACPASSSTGGGGSGRGRVFAGVNLHGGTLKVKHGVATVTLSSALAATGTLKLTDVINPKTGRVISAKSTRKTVLLGKKAFSVNTGQTKKVKIRLSSRARKLLKAHKKLKATLSAISTDTYGTHKTTKKKVTLK